MKILILTHKIPYPHNDGGTIATFNMITGLADAGAKVDVLCMQTPKHNSDIAKIPDIYKNNITWNQVFVDTKINLFDALINFLFSKKPYNAQRFESNDYNSKLESLLQKQEYDIIQLEGLYLAPYTKTIRKHSNAKIVMRSHNIEHKIWERMVSQEINILKKTYKKSICKRIKNMEKDTLNLFDCLVPISSVDSLYFEKYFNGNIKVSPTGIPDNIFSKTTLINNNNPLFYIGALDWEPNQEGLLWFINEVWPLLNTNDNYCFNIAGRNAPNWFKNRMSVNGINFIGEIDDAYSFMDKHNIMVVPLFSGSGIRIKIIEGMARSKCVITTKTGAEGIPAESGKDLFICDNAENMTKTILHLMNNPELAEEISNNAYEFTEKHFKNKNTTKELFNYYKNKIIKC